MTLTDLAKKITGGAGVALPGDPQLKTEGEVIQTLLQSPDGSLAEQADLATGKGLPKAGDATTPLPALGSPVKPAPLPKEKALIPYAGKEKAGDNGKVIDDGLSIPGFMKAIPASERGFNDTKGVEMARKLAAAAKLPVPPASEGRIARAITEKEAEKTVERVGRLKAKKAGLVASDKPLEGKAALEAIKDAQAKVAKADKQNAEERKMKALAQRTAKKKAADAKKATAAAAKAAAKAKKAELAAAKAATAKKAKAKAGPGKAAGKRKAIKAPKVAAVAKNAPANAAASPVAARPGTKTEQIRVLLTRKEGCTTAEVLAATGWPAVSMPQQAKVLGLSLRKEKAKGENTRYFAEA